MNKNHNWYSHTRFLPMARMELITRPKQVKRIEKRYDIDIDRGHYEVWSTFAIHEGMFVGIVMLPKTNHSTHGIQGVIAHEAVHLTHRYMEFIGEDRPSEEFIAYVVQEFAQLIGELYELATR